MGDFSEAARQVAKTIVGDPAFFLVAGMAGMALSVALVELSGPNRF